jgi:hypothetical protein
LSAEAQVRRKNVLGILWPAVALACACSGQGGGESAAPAEETPRETAAEATADACAALSQSEIEQAVGNPVLPGEPDAGPEVCNWDTENPDHVSVLLIVRPKGSTREETLCADLREAGGEGERLSGLGDVAVWKFSAMGTMFNSGDLEACGPRGFVSISLNGKADEPKLKEAAIALVGKVMGG